MGVEGIDRREFIVRTALGLITVGLGVPPVRAASTQLGKSPKIVYRTLGKTELRIPLVSFGVMNSDSPDLIRKAIDMGMKLPAASCRELHSNFTNLGTEIQHYGLMPTNLYCRR